MSLMELGVFEDKDSQDIEQEMKDEVCIPNTFATFVTSISTPLSHLLSAFILSVSQGRSTSVHHAIIFFLRIRNPHQD